MSHLSGRKNLQSPLIIYSRYHLTLKIYLSTPSLQTGLVHLMVTPLIQNTQIMYLKENFSFSSKKRNIISLTIVLLHKTFQTLFYMYWDCLSQINTYFVLLQTSFIRYHIFIAKNNNLTCLSFLSYTII